MINKKFMQEKEFWEKLHQEDYNRFILTKKPLRAILKPYRKILSRSTTILDLGCGGGIATEYLRKYCTKNLFIKKEVRTYGIDISSITIANTEKKYSKIFLKFAMVNLSHFKIIFLILFLCIQ